LPGDEQVRPTEKDLRGQVPAQFTTERALDRDGLKWKVLSARWHIAAAIQRNRSKHFVRHLLKTDAADFSTTLEKLFWSKTSIDSKGLNFYHQD